MNKKLDSVEKTLAYLGGCVEMIFGVCLQVQQRLSRLKDLYPDSRAADV